MPLTIEEMEDNFKRAQDEKERIELMNNYAYLYKAVYPEYFIELTERAYSLARRVGWPRGLALALANRGLALADLAKYDEARELLVEAEGILRGLEPEEQGGLNRILNMLGCICQERANYKAAAVYFREALNLSEESRDTLMLGKVYSNLTYIYQSLEQYELSLHYAEKSVKILETGEDSFPLIIALNNAGETYGKLGRYDEALDYLNRAFELVRHHKVEQLEVAVMYTLGELYLSMRRFEQAEQVLRKALSSKTLAEKPIYGQHTLIGMAKLYLEKDELERSLDYLHRALNLSKESNININLLEIYMLLFQVNKRAGRYEEALSYYELYSEKREEQHSLKLDSSIRNVEAESLKRANERIKIISTIGREITSNLHLQSLLNTIYRSVNSLMEATVFGVADYERESGRIKYDKIIQEGKSAPVFYFQVDNMSSLAAYAIRNNSDVFINNLDKEGDRYLKGKKLGHIGIYTDGVRRTRSALFTPLLIEGEITGVLTVQSYRENTYNYSDLDSLRVLASYIAIALKNARQAEQIKNKNIELKRLAITDYLTGLYNRREFERRFYAIWNSTTGNRSSLSILLLDADHFKMINDRYGHPVGDDYLRKLSELLCRTITGPSSCIARYGGEEFIILLRCRASEALEWAEKIRAEVEKSISLTVSIGVSSVIPSLSGSPRGADRLISRADEALYLSKEGGRNRVTYLDYC